VQEFHFLGEVVPLERHCLRVTMVEASVYDVSHDEVENTAPNMYPGYISRSDNKSYIVCASQRQELSDGLSRLRKLLNRGMRAVFC